MKKLTAVLLTAALVFGAFVLPTFSGDITEIDFGESGCVVGESYAYLPNEITAAELLDFITPATVTLVDHLGNTLSGEAPVMTGAVISLCDGEAVLKSYTLVLLGDVNCDGKTDTSDARIALRIVARLEAPKAYYVLLACDVDSTATETTDDARSILKGAAGLESRNAWMERHTADYPSDHVLVLLNKSYYSPDGNYNDLFSFDNIKTVKVIFDVDQTVILNIVLVEGGNENTERLIRQLNAMPEVALAGKDEYIVGL